MNLASGRRARTFTTGVIGIRIILYVISVIGPAVLSRLPIALVLADLGSAPIVSSYSQLWPARS